MTKVNTEDGEEGWETARYFIACMTEATVWASGLETSMFCSIQVVNSCQGLEKFNMGLGSRPVKRFSMLLTI